MVVLKRIPQLFFLVAFVALVTLFSSDPSKPANAQTADYTTTWTATDLIVATLRRAQDPTNLANCTQGFSLGNLGNPANSEVAIGVAKWDVKGRIGSSTKYKETWSTPELPSAFNFAGNWGGSCNNFRLILNGNNNVTDWLWGYTHNSTLEGERRSAVTFRTVGVTNSINSVNNLEPGNVKNIGKTTSCQEENRCLFTSGPYSWATIHELDEAGRTKYHNQGTMIPLRWSVSGYLCEGTDSRCD